MIRINYEYNRKSIYIKRPNNYKELIQIISNFERNIQNVYTFAFNFSKGTMAYITDDNGLKNFYFNKEFYPELFIFDKNLLLFHTRNEIQNYQYELTRQKEIEKNIRECELEIKKLNEEQNNLKMLINTNEETLAKLKRQDLVKIIELEKPSIDDLIPKYDDKDPLNFYDIIVDINSIKEIVNGWKILMNKRGKEKFKEVEETAIKIGVIGNGNKGKSFLLSKISKIELPVGTSIKTKGLSIKFPDLENYKNRNIILLDSAGQETPVLNTEKLNESKLSSIEKNEQKQQERLTEKSRDKLLTEFFLQNYIIQYSDLLLLVVGILTFSEQKLINKLKRTFVNLKKDNNLVIIHNLQSYVTKKQVDDYIRDTLTKSDTFELKEEKVISLDLQENNWTYFYEPNSKPNTIHLIYAREGSEAGNFYNQNTIKKILELTNSITRRQPLNLSENIKNLFLHLSSDILETHLKNEELIQENNVVKLNIEKNTELKLKKCSIDELGLNKFSSTGLEPIYSYYIKEENKDKGKQKRLTIICEIPGLDKESFDCKIEWQNGQLFFKIQGIKKNDLSELEKKNIKITSKREFGSFNLDLFVPDVNIDINSGQLDYKDGLVIISYAVIEINTFLSFNKKESKNNANI